MLGLPHRASRFDASCSLEEAGLKKVQLKPDEISAIVSHYADKDDPKKVFGTGFRIAGEKYLTLKADDRSLYGKKVR